MRRASNFSIPACICATVALLSSPAKADGEIQRSPRIDEAIELCEAFKLSGGETNAGIEAKIHGFAGTVLKRRAPHLEGDLLAQYQQSYYDGLKREALPAAVKDVMDCRLKALELLHNLARSSVCPKGTGICSINSRGTIKNSSFEGADYGVFLYDSEVETDNNKFKR